MRLFLSFLWARFWGNTKPLLNSAIKIKQDEAVIEETKTLSNAVGKALEEVRSNQYLPADKVIKRHDRNWRLYCYQYNKRKDAVISLNPNAFGQSIENILKK
jgi:hypothetical protein